MQVGKVPPAILALRDDLGLSIVAAAWVLSLFSAIGAVLGCLAGSIANRFGERATTIAALLCMAGASALGARADGAALLLVSRAIEGTAFVVAVVAIPSLLAASAGASNKRLVTGMWGTYMPTGMAMALFVAPSILLAFGWRTLWAWNAVLLLLVGIGLSVVRPPRVDAGARAAVSVDALVHTIKQRDVWLLALIFMCYTFQFLSVLGFLPTILEQQGVPPQAAGAQTAVAVISNAGGNIAASWLVARGFSPARLMAFALAIMAACTVGIFSSSIPPDGRYALAIAFSGFGGLVPAAIFATLAPLAARIGSGALAMGLVVQASHIGQVTGPPLVAALADASGAWTLSPLALIPPAAIAIIAALRVTPR